MLSGVRCTSSSLVVTSCYVADILLVQTKLTVNFVADANGENCYAA